MTDKQDHVGGVRDACDTAGTTLFVLVLEVEDYNGAGKAV